MIVLQIYFVLELGKDNQIYTHDEPASVYTPYTFASQKDIPDTWGLET